MVGLFSSARIQGAVAVVTGLLYALSFPPFDLWPLAFVALVPALMTAPHLSVRRGLWFGAGAAVAAVLVSSVWMIGSVERFFSVPTAGGVAFLLGVAVWMVLPYALMVAAVAFVHAGEQTVRPLASVALLLAGELLRATLQPYPWTFTGHAMLGSLPLAQLAEVGGLTGLSALCFLVNALLARALYQACLRRGVRQVVWPVACATALVVGVSVAGRVRVTTVAETTSARWWRVALVQAASAGVAAPRPHPEAYVALSRAALAERPDLIVWPETTLAGEPERFSRTLAPLFEAMAGEPTHLLVGAAVFDRQPGGELSVHNSAFLLRGPHVTLARYDKRYLVPFGEYLPEPFARLVSSGRWREQHLGVVDTSRGAEDQGLVRVGGVALAPWICHEVLLAHLGHDAVHRGADALVVLSNDSWAPNEAVARFVLRVAQLRAIETRLPLVRSGYPGGSGLVLPSGELAGLWAWGSVGAPIVEVPLSRIPRLWHLEWLLQLAAGVGALVLLVARWVRRRRG